MYLGEDAAEGFVIQPGPVFKPTAERVAAFLRGMRPAQVTASLGPGTALMTGGVVVIRIYAWPLLRVVFRPGYRVWRSPDRWGVSPPR